MGIVVKFTSYDEQTKVECFADNENLLVLEMEDYYGGYTLKLDKSTAIKLSKEIRKQIALLD